MKWLEHGWTRMKRLLIIALITDVEWPRRMKSVRERDILLILHNRCGPTLWSLAKKAEWRASAPGFLRREPALLMNDTLSVKILWKVSNPYAWCTYSINNWTRAPLLLFVVQNIIPISSRLKTFNQFSLTLEMLVEDGFTHEMSVRLHLEMIKRMCHSDVLERKRIALIWETVFEEDSAGPAIPGVQQQPSNDWQCWHHASDDKIVKVFWSMRPLRLCQSIMMPVKCMTCRAIFVKKNS